MSERGSNRLKHALQAEQSKPLGGNLTLVQLREANVLPRLSEPGKACVNLEPRVGAQFNIDPRTLPRPGVHVDRPDEVGDEVLGVDRGQTVVIPTQLAYDIQALLHRIVTSTRGESSEELRERAQGPLSDLSQALLEFPGDSFPVQHGPARQAMKKRKP